MRSGMGGDRFKAALVTPSPSEVARAATHSFNHPSARGSARTRNVLGRGAVALFKATGETRVEPDQLFSCHVAKGLDWLPKPLAYLGRKLGQRIERKLASHFHSDQSLHVRLS